MRAYLTLHIHCTSTQIWEAEEKKAQDEKQQEELRQQYLKEQEIYRSKELLGKANPLDFMYEPPPGFVKDEEGRSECEGKLELKFDWQKPGRTAPREEYVYTCTCIYMHVHFCTCICIHTFTRMCMQSTVQVYEFIMRTVHVYVRAMYKYSIFIMHQCAFRSAHALM